MSASELHGTPNREGSSGKKSPRPHNNAASGYLEAYAMPREAKVCRASLQMLVQLLPGGVPHRNTVAPWGSGFESGA